MKLQSVLLKERAAMAFCEVPESQSKLIVYSKIILPIDSDIYLCLRYENNHHLVSRDKEQFLNKQVLSETKLGDI